MKRHLFSFLIFSSFFYANSEPLHLNTTGEDFSISDSALFQDFEEFGNACSNERKGIQTAEQQAIFGWIVTKVINFVGGLFEGPRGCGEYDEPGHQWEGPYFLFNNTNPANPPWMQMLTLRQRIISQHHNYHKLYEEIYKRIDDPYNHSCNGLYNPTTSDIKACAFVFLVGLKRESNGDLTPLSSEERYFLRDKALTFLGSAYNADFDSYIRLRDGANFFMPLGALGLPNAITMTYAGTVREKMQYRAKELLMMIQTLDMVKWCTKIDPFVISDEEKVLSAEDHLKKHWIVPMHEMAQAPLVGMYYAHNNYTLMTAAALGAAAIELWERGDDVCNVTAWPRRWANSANYNIHHTMWEDATIGVGKKMSEPGFLYGFSEGPHYFVYSFESLLPYFVAKYNYKSADYVEPYYSFLSDLSPRYVRNFYHDPDYKNLYEWFYNITQPDDAAPSYDDTYHNEFFNGALALSSFGSDGYHYVTNKDHLGLEGQTGIILHPDYMAMLSNPISDRKPPQIVQMPSGNHIVRGKDKEGNTHYFHFLAEQGTPNAEVHEHYDAGSFIIGVGDVSEKSALLAIDPGYFGENSKNFVGGFDQHNVVSVNGTSPGLAGPILNGVSAITPMDLHDPAHITFTYKMGDTWQRDVEVVNEEDRNKYYYIIHDIVHNTDTPFNRTFTLNVNANGESSFTGTFYSPASNIGLWTYPCTTMDKQAGWGLKAVMTCSDPTVSFSSSPFHPHGNRGGFVTNTASSIFSSGLEGIDQNSSHDRMLGTVTTTDYEITFTTKLYPEKCKDIPTRIDPSGGLFQSNGNSTVILEGIAGPLDTALNFHMARTHKNSSDTIINPFKLDTCTKVLDTDAETIFASISTRDQVQSKGCISMTNFRKASIKRGTYLKYDTSMFINAQSSVNASYRIIGRFKYKGSVTTTTTTYVTFCMPDLEYGYEMSARIGGVQGMPSTHRGDSAYKYIKVQFPAGTTVFTLELTDPCSGGCFFPPTATTIFKPFDFNEGTLEYLDHDLDCVADTGLLRISNGSKMSICSGFVFRNLDSITMKNCVNLISPAVTTPGSSGGTGGDPGPTGSAINGSIGPIDARLLEPGRNMIIINDLAALVLDSASYTHVGAYSTILVRSGGTLLVRKGAVLEIGSSCTLNHGELIAEPGSFVCVEDSADIHFYDDIDTLQDFSDTSDRNIVYIAKGNPPLIPGALAAVNTSGGHGKFLPDSIYGNSACIPFCDWKTYNLPWGVNKRSFGWCNINYPVARFTSQADTVCVGYQVRMDAHRSLNETSYNISACRYDTALDACLYSVANIEVGDTQRLGRSIPVFTVDTSGYYKMRLLVRNDCGELDSMISFIYSPPMPSVALSAPDSACPGYRTVLADGSSSTSGLSNVHHIWRISVVTPDTFLSQGSKIDYEGKWDIDSSGVGDSFDFPGFRFFGGMKYAIGLTVYGWCGGATQWDTVNIPLGAYVKLNQALTYSNPIGPAAFQINAYAPGATSFNWTPTTHLNDSEILDPVSLPSGPIQYVLTTTDGLCTDYDTVNVFQNDLAYAGHTKHICAGDTIVLGTHFNGPMFLGIMAYAYADEFISSAYAPFREIEDLNFAGVCFTKFLIDHVNDLKGIPGGQNFLNMDSTLRKIQTTWWFADYMLQCRNDNLTTNNLSTFATLLSSDPVLSAEVNVFGTPWSGDPVTQFATLFSSFQSTCQYSDPDHLHITWEYKTEEDTAWLPMSAFADYYNVVDTPMSTRQYRITVLDGINSIVEYDSTFVLVDTALAPLFSPVFQLDSTIYFSNQTPVDAYTTFEWDFGDGSPNSALFAPVHTFPAFDSAYIVCLTATNFCGSFAYCDTVVVDSEGLTEGFGKRGTETAETLQKLIAQSPLKSGENHLAVNIPNPFKDETFVRYSLEEGYRTAEVRIITPLGQVVNTYKLNNTRGALVVNGEALHDGLYYYSLIVDGAVVDSRVMMVGR